MSIQRLTLLPQALPELAPREERPLPRELPEITSITRLAQGGRWRTEAMRSYDRPVLLWITRGQGRLTISGQSGGYGPHNAIFLPAGTMHGYSLAGSVLGHVVWLPRDGAGDWPSAPVHLRLHDARRQRELTGQIAMIEGELMQDAPQADDAVRLHTRLLSIWFSRAINELTRGNGDAAPSRARKLTEAYTALIEQDFRRPVGVQHFARALGVTPTHLSRVCRSVSGRPALDLLADRRHFEACRMLRDTTLPVSDIARQTGFRSAAYFTRAFKARTAMTPSAFRTSG